MSLTPANIRAMEATWPLELVVCKRIAEVIAESRPTLFKHGTGTHPTQGYRMGFIIGIANDPAWKMPRQIKVAFFHSGAFHGTDHTKGVSFRVSVRRCTAPVQVAISEEDFGLPAERDKLIEFMGNRVVHALTNPLDFEKTGAAG